MTLVEIDARRDVPGGDESAPAYLRAYASRIRTDGAVVTFPDPMTFVINGLTDCDIPESTPEFFWTLELGRERGVISRRKYVALSGEMVTWADVQEIDPGTYDPIDPSDVPNAQQVLLQAGQARDAAQGFAGDASTSAGAASAAASAAVQAKSDLLAQKGAPDGVASLDDDALLPESQVPERLTDATLRNTYVTFLNHDLTPVIGGKHVLITLTADGTDIDNIQVVTP